VVDSKCGVQYVRSSVRAIVSPCGGRYLRWTVSAVDSKCGVQYVRSSVRAVGSMCGGQ